MQRVAVVEMFVKNHFVLAVPGALLFSDALRGCLAIKDRPQGDFQETRYDARTIHNYWADGHTDHVRNLLKEKLDWTNFIIKKYRANLFAQWGKLPEAIRPIVMHEAPRFCLSTPAGINPRRTP